MPFSKIAFRVFASIAIAGLVVSTVFAVRSIRQYNEAHSGNVGNIPLGKVQDFSFKERNGGVISKKELLGKVWVAGFIFTRCPSACPKISETMAHLQKEVGADKLQMVSFTVDPEFDTEEELQKYADKYKAPQNEWLFLTGEKETIHQFIKESFFLAVGKAESRETEPGIFAMDIAHSSRLALVDQSGNVQGYFDSTDPVSMRRLEMKSLELIDQVH